MTELFDRIILGAGLYGLYAALFCARRGMRVLVLEADDAPFMRATYINQARVHMGYHYPRSLTTAMKSAGYFHRFCEDFGFCIHKDFSQVYATSEQFSWTNAAQFKEFCDAAGIFCREVSVGAYLKEGSCDGAFLTEEYTYDAHILRDHFLKELQGLPGAVLRFDAAPDKIAREGADYIVTAKGTDYASSFVLNATYASVNQLLKTAGALGDALFPIKYELCEIILCKASESLKNVGITVMDGPFFSIMPFGKTGLHSLTAVTFTPHMASFEETPVFRCQKRAAGHCSPERLGNCTSCPARPESAWPYMSHLADKYLLPEFSYEYDSSLFSMKPILKSSEVDDSRPTAIRYYSKEPVFLSVLSGKINTVYDLDEYLI